MNLYEITGDYLRLMEMMQSPDEWDEQALADTLEAIEGELEDKADNYARIMKELDAEAEKFSKEADRLSERSATLQTRSKTLKQWLFDAMKVTGKEKFKTDFFSFGIQKNGGKKPLKITGTKEDIPKEFCELVPSNAKIREALENGQELDFAHLEEPGEHLRIK